MWLPGIINHLDVIILRHALDSIWYVANDCQVPMCVLVDRNDDVIVREEIDFRGPGLDAIIVDPALGRAEFLEEEGAKDVNLLEDLGRLSFQRSLEVADVEADEIVVEKLSLIQPWNVFVVHRCSILPSSWVYERSLPALPPFWMVGRPALWCWFPVESLGRGPSGAAGAEGRTLGRHVDVVEGIGRAHGPRQPLWFGA